jgi:hypothetical protein
MVMEHFDKWREYWDNYLLNKYGKPEVQTEADLYFQVARTLHKKPIDKPIFDHIVHEMVQGLALEKGDILVDLCCGNGLFTYELKGLVSKIIGVDFAPQIIHTALDFKKADNITYYLSEVNHFLRDFKMLFPWITPNKYLNNDSLAYFSFEELEEMLEDIIAISGDDFHFLIRGVPNADLMWNYYNTEERKLKYLTDRENGDYTNDGLGRWWLPEEIETICKNLGLTYFIHNQEVSLSNYRMDILIGS